MTKNIPIETYSAFQNWKPLRDEIIKLKKEGTDHEATLAAQKQMTKYVEMLFEKTKLMTDFARNKADEVYTEMKYTEKVNISIILSIFIFSILTSLLVAYYVSRSISKPINEFIVQIEKLYKKG